MNNIKEKFNVINKALAIISGLMIFTVCMSHQAASAVDIVDVYYESTDNGTVLVHKTIQKNMLSPADNAVTYDYSALKGEGTKKAPYRIETKDDLVLFRDMVNGGLDFNGKYVEQTADIDLSGENWLPIGVVLGEHYFYGTYNGNGHIINNLYINEPNQPEYMYGGFFGMLGGTVENLGIENGDINGHCIGGITSHGVGSPIIVNCYYKGKLTATERAGGIADNVGGIIANCYFEGEINAPEAYGIASYQAGQIINCAYVGDYACCSNLTTTTINNMQFSNDNTAVSEFFNNNFSQMVNQGFDGHTFNQWAFYDDGNISLSNKTVGCFDYIGWIMIIASFSIAFASIIISIFLLRTKKESRVKNPKPVNTDE